MRVSICFLAVVGLVLLWGFPSHVSAARIPGFGSQSTEDYIVQLNRNTKIEPFLQTEGIKANGKWDWINCFSVSLTTAEVASLGRNRAVKSITYDTEIVLESVKIQLLIAEGMHVVAAAGNQGKDVATRSPARLSSVITVGASNLKYRATTRSNYGPRVDIFAPGYQIDTAKTGSTSGTSLAHGTSMATAHVAGVVVCIISQHGNLPPARMATKVKEWASDGVLIGLREDTANKLAFIRT
ncbi:Subtilisin-like protease 3 [Termitomyces sp. T112]|nr:Subtilisin-like protease 3 [Termitomyces sp. T112]